MILLEDQIITLNIYCSCLNQVKVFNNKKNIETSDELAQKIFVTCLQRKGVFFIKQVYTYISNSHLEF